MIITGFVVALTFCILVIAEYLARAKGIHAEVTRKLVHIAVGSFVAFWPFFLGWGQIEFLALAFLAVVGVSIRFNIFRSIHAVQRNIAGELFFAVVIGILALICSSKWIFMAAMLHLSLADGLAAVVGVRWGKNNSYKILGEAKSVAGSVAFVATSILIMAGYLLFGHTSNSALMLAVIPAVAVFAENISNKGTDNLTVPILVAFILSAGR